MKRSILIGAITVLLIGVPIVVQFFTISRYPSGPLRTLRNSDVEFYFSYGGWEPLLENSAKEIHSRQDPNDIPFLFEMLNDPDRFVAAHVLLTLLVQRQWIQNTAEWNGIPIEMTESGVRCDLSCQYAIKLWWEGKRNVLARP